MQVNSLCTNFLKKAENCYCILYTKMLYLEYQNSPSFGPSRKGFFFTLF